MKLKLIAAVAALLGTSAFAAPIALQPGPVYAQFNNLEQVGLINTGTFSNLNVGGSAVPDLLSGQRENNWGLFNVSSLQRGAVSTPNVDISGGMTYFADGFSGGQIHGIFYGLQFGIDAMGNPDPTTLTGGYMDFYWTDGEQLITSADLNGGFAPTNRTDWNVAGKFTQGQLLVRLQFDTGAISGDMTTTVESNVNPLSFSGTGQADGFANVVDINGDGVIDAADGLWAPGLNGDWFFVDPNGNGTPGESGETRDLRFSTLFQNLDLWDSATAQGLRSNDPARAFVVPEPGSVALVGAALLGLGIARRRKAK